MVSDKKLFIDNTWQATVLSAQDYYPFGMSMPNRKWQGSSTYRFDFNGKEKDPETELNDFGARFYAANLGRWLSIDPLAAKFPAWSPYVAMNDNPIAFIDPDGRAPGDIIIVFTGHQLMFKNQPTTQILTNTLMKYSTGTVIQYATSNYMDLQEMSGDSPYNTIMQHSKNNPNGQIIIIGYSLGGEEAQKLANRLSNDGVKVSNLTTIDGTPRKSDERTVKVEENVLSNINYYQRNQTGDRLKDGFNLHGGPNKGKNVKNINMSNETMNGQKITHYNTDGATMGNVAADVLCRTENLTDEQINQIRNETNRKLEKVEKN